MEIYKKEVKNYDMIQQYQFLVSIPKTQKC